MTNNILKKITNQSADNKENNPLPASMISQINSFKSQTDQNSVAPVQMPEEAEEVVLVRSFDVLPNQGIVNQAAYLEYDLLEDTESNINDSIEDKPLADLTAFPSDLPKNKPIKAVQPQISSIQANSVETKLEPVQISQVEADDSIGIKLDESDQDFFAEQKEAIYSYINQDNQVIDDDFEPVVDIEEQLDDQLAVFDQESKNSNPSLNVLKATAIDDFLDISYIFEHIYDQLDYHMDNFKYDVVINSNERIRSINSTNAVA